VDQENPVAVRRCAHPARRLLPLGEERGQRERAGGQQPLAPRSVVVAVDVQVPGGPVLVRGQPRRRGLGEQIVEPFGGVVGPGGEENRAQSLGSLGQLLEILLGELDRADLAVSTQHLDDGVVQLSRAAQRLASKHVRTVLSPAGTPVDASPAPRGRRLAHVGRLRADR